MTTLPSGGRAGPPSRLMIHADEPGQANRLALLVSHYGHQPQILDSRQLLSPNGQGDALLISSRQFGAEVRLGLSLWLGLPRLLFCERIGPEPQITLLQQGVLLVPHPCGEREPVEQWLRLARSQLAMVQALAQTESELRQQLVDRRLVEQAKGRLMRHQGLDEEQAYRLMRSTAMNRHLSLGELARQLLLALPA
ncbi:ANTAR domain-containing response regulator [Aeromonas salmonicida]|uniref:ANTAR domain-containing response regulator n=1 Tax=Aeromonas salmonicida TaxID=645 RepID=UPI001BA9C180|nr:ANTAR domain-containing protein [Aeromonas salmonicida]MBS2779952.1 ANTAR domain-containing protein [Aeromonas salmonicida]